MVAEGVPAFEGTTASRHAPRTFAAITKVDSKFLFYRACLPESRFTLFLAHSKLSGDKRF
jgi:hypothetical protein